MPRAVPEWRGLTDDQPLPPRVRVRLFEKFAGRCAICTRKLRPGHWECDHIKALINGGENRESNYQPVCDVPCHKAKTASDVAEKSVNKRVHSKHVGVKKKRRTIAGRRFSGEAIPSRWK